MVLMSHAKFRFNWLMLTLIFSILASEPSTWPGERLKMPGLIGLRHLQTSDHRFRAISALISAASREKWIGMLS